MQRLFQITLVLLLAVVSIVVLGLVISIVISGISANGIAESSGAGISAVAGGLTNRQLGAIVIAASLIVPGCFLFFRRGRFRR